MAQRKRKQKTSSGLRRSSSPVHLTVVQKVNLGHGMLDSTEETDCKPWRGVGEIRGPLFDPEQAEFNRKAYPHLWGGGR